MSKKKIENKNKVSLKNLIKYRPFVGIASFFIFNSYLPGFIKGIYQGSSKQYCAPFINCHSCPSATFACPAGLIQHYFTYNHLFKVWILPKFVIGFLILITLGVGKLVCGWICPFGTIQTLLYRLKSIKFSIPQNKIHFVKYFIFLLMIIYLPILLGEPWFCKLCPVGSLEAGIPLVSFGNASSELRLLALSLFNIKLSILLVIILSSIFVKRPFCRFICPIGTIFTLFNKFSLLKIKVDDANCIHCGKCSKLCPIENEAPIAARSIDCYLCGECVRGCPTSCVSFNFKPMSLFNIKQITSDKKNKA